MMFIRFTAAFVAHSFTPSHMTCKKCKYEFCWVCMGAGLCFAMVVLWLLTVCYAHIQVPGRSTGRHGIRVIDSMRRRALTPAMHNRRAVPRLRDTYTSVAHDPPIFEFHDIS